MVANIRRLSKHLAEAEVQVSGRIEDRKQAFLARGMSENETIRRLLFMLTQVDDHEGPGAWRAVAFRDAPFAHLWRTKIPSDDSLDFRTSMLSSVPFEDLPLDTQMPILRAGVAALNSCWTDTRVELNLVETVGIPPDGAGDFGQALV